MGSLMNRVLMAYRPLYLRGLLMDGQYRLPPSPEPPAHAGHEAVLGKPRRAERPGRRHRHRRRRAASVLGPTSC